MALSAAVFYFRQAPDAHHLVPRDGVCLVAIIAGSGDVRRRRRIAPHGALGASMIAAHRGRERSRSGSSCTATSPVRQLKVRIPGHAAAALAGRRAKNSSRCGRHPAEDRPRATASVSSAATGVGQEHVPQARGGDPSADRRPAARRAQRTHRHDDRARHRISPRAHRPRERLPQCGDARSAPARQIDAHLRSRSSSRRGSRLFPGRAAQELFVGHTCVPASASRRQSRP